MVNFCRNARNLARKCVRVRVLYVYIVNSVVVLCVVRSRFGLLIFIYLINISGELHAFLWLGSMFCLDRVSVSVKLADY